MKRSLFIRLVLLSIFFSMVQQSFLTITSSATTIPQVREGLLDLSRWNLTSDGPLSLDGAWTFYWDQLLEPQDLFNSPVPSPTGFFNVSTFWDTSYGSATYHLKIRNNQSQAPLAIKLLNVYSAASIWVNGKLQRTIGVPGEDAATTIPRFTSSAVIDIGSVGEQLDIVIQLSNYNNPQGGVIDGLLIGTSMDLHAIKQREVIQDSFVFGALLIMSIYHFILYLLRRKDVSPFHFSMFCLCIAIRTLLVNSRFPLDLLPEITWAWFAKLSYLTVYVGLFFLISFIHHLFPRYYSLRIMRCNQWFCGAITALVLFTDIQIYDKSLIAFEAVAMYLLVYAIHAAIRGIIHRQAGGYIFITGFIILLLAAINDIFARLHWLSTPVMVQYGVLFFIFLQSVILSMKFSRAFTQVEQLSERLLSLDKLKDEFLAKTSHELRTPLMGIIGLTESLIDGTLGKPPPKAAHMLDLIRISSNRLSHLVNDILDFSKMKNNDLHIRPIVVNVGQITELMVLLLAPLATKKGLLLENHVGDNILVYADENRIQQIMHNLIGNAIKFTEQGSITITAQREDKQVNVHISDTGIGIPSHELSRIFESFEQLEAVMERHGGTGIGLAITKQLLELQQGQISVTSTLGKGSVFTFTLPSAFNDEERVEPHIVLRGQETIAATTDSARLVWMDTAEMMSVEGPTVMIIDDDPIIVEVLVQYLHGRYRIIETSNGFEALRWMEEGMKIDIVLLDIMMPHISGFQICQQIRSTYNASELPVLFLSAKNQVTDLITAFDLGANDYILKPANKQELLARIGMHLQLSDWNHSLEEELQVRTLKLKNMMNDKGKAMVEISILEERNRIAQEIHDQVGQTLTASIVQMEAGMLLARQDADAAIKRMHIVSELIRQSLQEMRQSVHMLYDQSQELDLFSSLIKLIQDMEKYAEVSIEYEIEPFTEPIVPAQEKLIYHALQEGITNGIKHGNSRSFKFQLTQAEGLIRFRLDNDGQPFNSTKLGFGLTALKRNVELHHGFLRISSAHLQGCLLELTLPYLKGAINKHGQNSGIDC